MLPNAINSPTSKDLARKSIIELALNVYQNALATTKNAEYAQAEFERALVELANERATAQAELKQRVNDAKIEANRAAASASDAAASASDAAASASDAAASASDAAASASDAAADLSRKLDKQDSTTNPPTFNGHEWDTGAMYLYGIDPRTNWPTQVVFRSVITPSVKRTSDQTIMRRDTYGRSKVNNPIDDRDIVNLQFLREYVAQQIAAIIGNEV